MQHDVRLLSHGPQNLAAGQRRSDRVAVRPRVRREHEPFTLLDLMENVPQHHCAFFMPGFV
jgi:chromosome condensin MukBEF ATPase and DNA-binding subunit MukB